MQQIQLKALTKGIRNLHEQRNYINYIINLFTCCNNEKKICFNKDIKRHLILMTLDACGYFYEN